MAHAGRDNGFLVVSHANLIEIGVADGTQAEAIRELVALGFAEVTERGRLSYGSVNRASRFRLTFLPTAEADGVTIRPATNNWKAIATDAEADALRRASRKAPRGGA